MNNGRCVRVCVETDSGRTRCAAALGFRVRLPAAAAVLAVVLAIPGSLLAWGPEGHAWIHARALECLPAELSALLGADARQLVERASEPDEWRRTDPGEHPRHFIDLDRYGDFPFASFSLDYQELLRRHGEKTVLDNGVVLWTVVEVMERLEKAFRAGDRPAMLREAVALGHYVADLHQPFHAVANYDGQLSGQDGIHARFEVEVAKRVLPALRGKASSLRAVEDPLRLVFDIALESFSMVNLVLVPEWQIVRDLGIDRGALPRHPQRRYALYPEEYFRELTRRTGRLAEERMQEAAWVVASFWTQAWKSSLEPGR